MLCRPEPSLGILTWSVDGRRLDHHANETLDGVCSLPSVASNFGTRLFSSLSLAVLGPWTAFGEDQFEQVL